MGTPLKTGDGSASSKTGDGSASSKTGDGSASSRTGDGSASSYGAAPHDIRLEVKYVGGDILAVVTGGTRPHIGAVALAEPADAPHPVTSTPTDASAIAGKGSTPIAPSVIASGERTDDKESLRNSEAIQCQSSTTDQKPQKPPARVSLLSAAGHKDAVLAEMFARGLCERFGVAVCATAGVHVDGASESEIALMVENAQELLKLAIET